MAAHQIVVYACLRFGHVFVQVGRFYILDVDVCGIKEMFAVGCKRETLHTCLHIGDLTRCGAVGFHRPYLHGAAAIGEKPYFAAVVVPNGSNGIGRGVGQKARRTVVHVVQYDDRYAAIFGHVVAGQRIEQCRAVGRQYGRTYASHFPHNLGRKPCCGNLFGRERVVYFERYGCLFAAAQPKCDNSHTQSRFFHNVFKYI